MALAEHYHGLVFRLHSPDPTVLVIETGHGAVTLVDQPHLPLTLERVWNALVTLDAEARRAAGEFE